MAPSSGQKLNDYFQAITRFAQTSYFTKVACEKLASNLKFYRSLNTRKPPSNHLLVRVKDCMISYSAATTDNSVGRVGPENLNRVFAADDARAWSRKKSIRRVSKMKMYRWRSEPIKTELAGHHQPIRMRALITYLKTS